MDSSSDSFESRLREMAADRLLETVQFAKSKAETVENGSTTSLLLSMAQTMRACMRDWPSVEDNALAGIERAQALNDLKKALKEARRLTRSSALDSLVFVCSDALFLMAEQWPAAKGAAGDNLVETFPLKREIPSTSFQSMDDRMPPKKPRMSNGLNENHGTNIQYFPPYPEVEGEDEEEPHTESGGQPIDAYSLFPGLIKSEETEEMSNGDRSDHSMAQTAMDIWSTQNSLAALAAVTSSTSHPSIERDSDPSRIRVHRYFCPECNIGCVAKSQLDSHMNTHTGNRPFQCNYCEKNYKRKDHLSDHIKKNHPVEHAAAKQKKEAMKNKSSVM